MAVGGPNFVGRPGDQSKGSRASDGSDAPHRELAVGLFGKHPAWADFFGLGVETERLADARGTLFDEGINSNIEAGVWGNPGQDAERIVEGFRHLFVWLVGADVVIGRWWPSADSVGRRRPLAVCAQAAGVPPAWLIREVPPYLAQAEEACGKATTREDVEAAIVEARTQLRRRISEVPAFPPDPGLSQPSLQWFAPNAALGEGHKGLHRVLYEFNSMKSYVASGPQHVRVPACSDSPVEAALRWMDLLNRQLGPSVPLLAIVPLDSLWADLVIGRPNRLALTCIRREDVPFVTADDLDVPAEFVDAVEEEIAARSGDASVPGALTLNDVRTAGRRRAARRSSFAEVLRSFFSKKLLMLLGGGVLALVLLVTLLLLLSPSGTEDGVSDPSPGKRPVALQAVELNPETVETWQQLCDAYYRWFGLFLRDLEEGRLERWQNQTVVRELAVGIAGARARGLAFDPRIIADQPGKSLKALGNDPPSVLAQPEKAAAVEDVAAILVRIEQTLFSPASRLSGEIEKHAAASAERRWTRLASFLRDANRSLKPVPHVVEDVDKLLAVIGGAEAIERIWQSILRSCHVVEEAGSKSGSRILPRFGDYAEEAVRRNVDQGTWKDLDQLNAVMASVDAEAAALAGFVQGDWTARVDRPLFIREEASLVGLGEDDTAAKALFEQWRLAAARFSRLMPVEDPRKAQVAEWNGRIQAMNGRADQLQVIDQTKADVLRTRLGSAAFRGQLQSLMAIAPVRRNLPEIEERVAAIEKAVEALEREVTRALIALGVSRTEWLQAVQSLGFPACEALDTCWKARRTQLLGGLTVAQIDRLSDDEYLAVRTRTTALQSFLEAVEGDFEIELPENVHRRLSASWRNALIQAVRVRREAAFTAILGHVSWKGEVPELEFESLRTQVAEYARQRTDFGATVETSIPAFLDLDALERSLNACLLLPDRVVENDLTVAELAAKCRAGPVLRTADQPPLVSMLLGRVAALEETERSADRDVLVQRARAAASDRPEAVYAAWLRLGKLSTPGWPADQSEAATEQEIQEKVRGIAGAIEDPDRRALLRALVEAEALQRQIRYDMVRIRSAAAADDVLGRLPVHASATIERSASMPPRQRAETLRPLKTVVAEIANVVTEHWAKGSVDRELFQSEAEAYRLAKQGSPFSLELFAAWSQQASAYMVLVPDPRERAQAWRTELTQWRERTDGLARLRAQEAGSSDHGITALAGALEQASSAVAEVWRLPPVRKNEIAIRRKLTTVDAFLEQLADAEKRIDPGRWLERVRNSGADDFGASPALGRVWQQRRDELLRGVTAEQLKADRVKYNAVQSDVSALQNFLRGIRSLPALGRGVPGAGGGRTEATPWREALGEALRRRKELTIEKLIALAEWRGAIPLETLADFAQKPAVSSLCDGYATWCAFAAECVSLATTLEDFSLLQPGTDGEIAAMRDRAAEWRTSLNDEPDLAQAVAPLLASVERLAQIQGATERDGLLPLLPQAADLWPASAYMLWRQLGRLQDPVWPGIGGELRQERALRVRAQTIVKALGNRETARLLASELAEAGPKRWLAAVRQLNDADELKQALGSAADFGVAEELVASEIQRSTDRAWLAACAAAAPKQQAALAWRRLGQLPDAWPVTPQELTTEERIGRGQATQERQRRWRIAFAHLSGSRELDAVLSMADAFGVDLDAMARGESNVGSAVAGLPPEARFNILLNRARSDLGTADADRARSAVSSLAAAVSQLGAAVVDDRDVSVLLSRLGELVEGGDQEDTGDLQEAGPAKAGWRAVPNAQGTEVTYQKTVGDREVSLRFALVRPDVPEGRAAFLCTTEVSVRLLESMAHDPGRRQDLAKLFPGPEDTRDFRGAMVWKWSARGSRVSPAGEWIKTGLVLPESASYYPEGARTSRPSRSHPANRLGPVAAVYLAGSVGCRLPSVAEWAAAYAASESGQPKETWNLNDRSMARQRQYVAELANKYTVDRPCDDRFSLDGSEPGVDPAPAAEEDDGLVWFGQVDCGGGRLFHHLVGNVAEYVYANPADLEALTETSVRTATAVLDEHSDKLFVIGGSAFSSPNLPFDKPVPVDLEAAASGYSDVGFRLAFTAPVEPLERQLLQALRRQPYLKHPPVR